jgi:uncharacterized Zn finger protein (UPF0148 family)
MREVFAGELRHAEEVKWCDECGHPWKFVLATAGIQCPVCTLREMLNRAEAQRDEARQERDAAWEEVQRLKDPEQKRGK